MATKAAKETPKTEVATVSNSLPATMDASMLAADAGIGRESMSITDMALPYLLILQSLSPQVKKSSPQRVDGAEEGDIFNTVTQELFASEDGINVIPCAFQKAWVEWAPRDSGGGWIASHSSDQILNHCNRNEQGFDVRKDNGNIIVPTFNYAGRPQVEQLDVQPAGHRPARSVQSAHVRPEVPCHDRVCVECQG